jgi:hypothetical protein
MPGHVPEILWFFFWIGFVILAFRMAYLGGKSGYDTRMKALDILKMYAEKGTEPPPAMMDELTRQAFEHHSPPKHGSRSSLLMTFCSFLFMACVAWGVRAWLQGHADATWAPIAATAALAFFSLSALGFLLAALLQRQP